MNKKWILFYDSGIGGLTTLSEAMKIVDGVNFLYFADDKNCPYGNRTKSEILKLVKQNLNYIFKRFIIEMVVFACNTVTSCCIDELRRQINIPIVGIEPAVMLASKKSKTKEVLVVATNATINQEKYINLINKAEAKIYSVGCENLARDIENSVVWKRGVFRLDISEIKKLINEHKEIDKIVLGCTHYSYIKKMIEKETGVECEDGNFGVAKRIKTLLGEGSQDKKTENEVEIILSSFGEEKKQRYYDVLKALKNKEI